MQHSVLLLGRKRSCAMTRPASSYEDVLWKGQTETRDYRNGYREFHRPVGQEACPISEFVLRGSQERPKVLRTRKTWLDRSFFSRVSKNRKKSTSEDK